MRKLLRKHFGSFHGPSSDLSARPAVFLFEYAGQPIKLFGDDEPLDAPKWQGDQLTCPAVRVKEYISVVFDVPDPLRQKWQEGYFGVFTLNCPSPPAQEIDIKLRHFEDAQAKEIESHRFADRSQSVTFFGAVPAAPPLWIDIIFAKPRELEFTISAPRFEVRRRFEM